MAAFYVVEPEVAGGFGRNTVLDASTHPPSVSQLHYEFQGWLGDALVTSFPCSLVADGLKQAIEATGLSGAAFANAEVTVEEQFAEHQPDVANAMPRFWWFRVSGRPGFEDFGLLHNADLVVSERALDTLRSQVLENATVRPHKV